MFPSLRRAPQTHSEIRQPGTVRVLQLELLEERATPAAVTFDNSTNPARLSFDLNSDNEQLAIQSIGSGKVEYTTTGTFTGDVPVQGVTTLDLTVTPGIPVQVSITDASTITGAVAKFIDSGANAYPATPTTIAFDNNSGGVQFYGTTDFGFNVLSITADTTVSMKPSAVLRTAADLLLGGDRFDLQNATPLIPGSVDAVIDAGSATVTIRPATPGQELNIGGDDFSGFLGLTDDELDRITAGLIQIGSTAAGNAKITAPVSPAHTTKLTVTTGGKLFLDPTFPAGDTAFTIGDLTISAGSGVGTAAEPIPTAVNRIEAKTTTVGVFLANVGPLAVGGTGAATGGIQVTGASGAIDVSATGTLTVNDKVVAPGKIALTATGTTSDVVLQHNKSRGISSAGNTTTVRADRDIRIGTINGYGDVGGQGLVLVAGGDIVVNATSYVEANGAAGLQATAMGDVMILQSLGGGSVMNSNGGGGAVTVTAGAGQSFVLDQGFAGGVAANGCPITIAADNMTLTSGRIGTTGLVTLKPATAGRAVSLGTEVAGQLSLTDDELDLVNLPPPAPPTPTPTVQLQLGDSAAGAITLGGDISRPGATNLGLVSGGDIVSALGTGAIDTAGGTLTFTPGPGGAVKPLRSGTDTAASATSVAPGSDLTIDISGPTQDTQYSRLVTSGSISLNGVDLVLTGAYTPAPGDAFAIVSADGGLSGAFTGLPDGKTFNVNGQRVVVRYSPTAVTLSVVVPTLTATVTGGVLTVLDTGGVSDALTASVSGTNLVVTDPSGAFVSAPAGGTLSNGDQTLTIPLAGLTGLSFQLGGGDDTLAIDYSGGVIPVPVTFDGGGQATATGDALVVTGGSFATATHTFTAAGSGTIDFGGAAGAITYSGLEPVDTTGTTVGNLVLNLPAATANQAVLETNGSFDQIRSLNGTFETTAFSDPTGSLTVNRGTAQDTLSVTDLPNFTASLAVGTAAAPFAAVGFDGSLTLAAGNTLAASALSVAATTGTVAVTDGTVTVLADQVALAAGTALTAGAGTVTLAPVTDGRAIDLGGPDTATALGLTDAELDLVTAARLTVGRAGAGAVTLSAPVSIAPVMVPLFEIVTGGAIADGNATGADVTAAALAVSAGAAVGTAADPIDTGVANLEVTAGGGVFVTDAGPTLTVGGVLPTLAGVQAGGAVWIAASTGTLTVQEAIASTGDVTLVADEIDLTAGGGSVSGPGRATVRPATAALATIVNGPANAPGSLSLTATDLAAIGLPDLLVGGPGYTGNISTTGATLATNGLTLQTGGGVTLPAGIAATGAAAVLADGVVSLGPVKLSAATGLTVARSTGSAPAAVVLTGGGTTTLSSSGGPVTLAAGVTGTTPLAVTAGTGVSFGGNVGSAGAPLASLTVAAAGAVSQTPGTLLTAGSVNLTAAALGTAAAPVAFASPTVTTDTTTASGAQFLAATGSTAVGSLAAGTGTVTLSGGTFVTGTVSSPLAVGGGATLAGTGPVAAVTASAGGTVSPGQSPGSLATGNLALVAGSVFRAEVNGPTRGTGYDQLVVTGTVDLGGATLALSGALVHGPRATFVLIANDGADPVVGTFAGLPNNSPVAVNGVAGRVRYDGGDGNDVVFITAAPGQDTAREVAVSGGASVTLLNADGSVARTVAQPFGPGVGTRAAAADVTGDGVTDLVIGTSPGSPSRVIVIDGATGQTVFSVFPFEATFTGGTFVAAGDVDGDGFADVAVSADQTGGPRVIVYSGRTGTVLANFLGIDDANFRGGTRVALGDVTGDGLADVVVAAGVGGGPRVAVFDGATVRPGQTPTRAVSDFFAYEQTLRDGTFVTVGDVTGDGRGDLIVGGGPTGGARVLVLDAARLLAGAGPVAVADFLAGPADLRTGARVAAKDLDGDQRADLVVAVVTGSGATVRGYAGADLVAGGTPPVDVDFGRFDDAFGVFVG